MITATKTSTKTLVKVAAIAGIVLAAAVGIIMLNPRLRQYLLPTRDFRPYQILPGYVTPGYGTPGYTTPGYRR